MALQSISATKYHLISSMRLIAQLFLIFIYLFTSSLYRVFDDKYCTSRRECRIGWGTNRLRIH